MSNVDEAEYLREELDKFEELVKKIEDKHEEVQGCPQPKLCIYELLVKLLGMRATRNVAEMIGVLETAKKDMLEENMAFREENETEAEYIG